MLANLLSVCVDKWLKFKWICIHVLFPFVISLNHSRIVVFALCSDYNDLPSPNYLETRPKKRLIGFEEIILDVETDTIARNNYTLLCLRAVLFTGEKSTALKATAV